MTYSEQADEIASLMEDHLGVRGAGLEAKLRKVGRTLPRRIRDHAGVLLEATRLEGSPKLARRIDPLKTAASYEACEDYLLALDSGARRKGRFISILATTAFNLLIVAVLVVAVLVWRGFL